jgi:hypothetical protein
MIIYENRQNNDGNRDNSDKNRHSPWENDIFGVFTLLDIELNTTTIQKKEGFELGSRLPYNRCDKTVQTVRKRSLTHATTLYCHPEQVGSLLDTKRTRMTNPHLHRI